MWYRGGVKSVPQNKVGDFRYQQSWFSGTDPGLQEDLLHHFFHGESVTTSGPIHPLVNAFQAARETLPF
jgi:hypothetical protein